MNIRYDLKKMEQIITDLCVLTGISMAFLDTDQKMLFHYEKEGRFCSLLQRDPEVYSRCLCSDDIILNRCFENRRFEWHICHAGLFDAAMPIIKDGIFTGIILMGRVKLEGEALNSDNVSCKIPEFTRQKIQSLESLLPNMLFENAIFVEFDDRISEITEYIENNLSQALSIGGICKEFSISKNTLYSLFRERFNKTVIEHITEMRIEKAKKLLRETQSTIYEIAEAVGFDNHTYFCRLFKKREGFSATEYRKVHQSK